MKIQHAELTADGKSVVVCGDQPHFHVMNVETGKALYVDGITGM